MMGPDIISIIGYDHNNLTIISESGKDATYLYGYSTLEQVDYATIKGFTILGYVDLGDEFNSTISDCIIEANSLLVFTFMRVMTQLSNHLMFQMEVVTVLLYLVLRSHSQNALYMITRRMESGYS